MDELKKPSASRSFIIPFVFVHAGPSVNLIMAKPKDMQ
jgi:hypothetical protein